MFPVRGCISLYAGRACMGLIPVGVVGCMGLFLVEAGCMGLFPVGGGCMGLFPVGVGV